MTTAESWGSAASKGPQEATTTLDARLEGLRLGQCAAAFEVHGVDRAMLPELVESDVREIVLTALGHHKHLLDDIARLRVGRAPGD